MLAALGRMFGLDPRSPQEVEGDIADEFGFHIQMLEEELVRDGETPERARQIAAERFGDQEKFARECREIAFKEQRMWQKIQIGVIVFLLLAFVGSVLIFITVSRQQQAMAEMMRAQAEAMRVQAVQATEKAAAATRRASEAEAAGNGPVAAPSAAVFATGKIARPGSYPLAAGSKLSARQLVIESGGLSEGAKGSITVTRNDPKGEMIQLKTTARAAAAEVADIELLPGDIVDVE